MTATAPPTMEQHRTQNRGSPSSSTQVPRSMSGILLHTYCDHLRQSAAFYPACFTICQQLTYGKETSQGRNSHHLRHLGAGFRDETKQTLKPQELAGTQALPMLCRHRVHTLGPLPRPERYQEPCSWHHIITRLPACPTDSVSGAKSRYAADDMLRAGCRPFRQRLRATLRFPAAHSQRRLIVTIGDVRTRDLAHPDHASAPT